MSCFVLSALLS